jgi:hypothetical protein
VSLTSDKRTPTLHTKPNPQTPNSNPQPPNAKPHIPNPKPETPKPKRTGTHLRSPHIAADYLYLRQHSRAETGHVSCKGGERGGGRGEGEGWGEGGGDRESCLSGEGEKEGGVRTPELGAQNRNVSARNRSTGGVAEEVLAAVYVPTWGGTGELLDLSSQTRKPEPVNPNPSCPKPQTLNPKP